MGKLKKILINILYKLGIWSRTDNDSGVDAVFSRGLSPSPGIDGRLEAQAALLFEEGRIVLSVDHEFLDMPSWIEGDVQKRTLNIVQMGGAVATLDLLLPQAEVARMKKVSRIALVTKFGQENLLHYVSFILR